MAYSLCGAPATFARAINLVLRGQNWKLVLCNLTYWCWGEILEKI